MTLLSGGGKVEKYPLSSPPSSAKKKKEKKRKKKNIYTDYAPRNANKNIFRQEVLPQAITL